MILVIGGGWSGLACAVGLRRRTDRPITVLEAAPEFGGRARGLTWNDRLIDNGQHLTLGAYRETFELLDLVGAPQWERRPLVWAGVGTHRRIAQSWRVPSAGWPWRGLIGMLPGLGPRGWPAAWHRTMRIMLADLLRHRWRIDPALQWPSHHGPSVAQWLNHYRVPHDFVQHFWRPLAEGALNTEIESASARVLAIVLRDSLGGATGSCEVRTPRGNLSTDGVDAITAWLQHHDVTLRSHHRVEQLGPSAQQGWRVQLHRAGQPEVLNAQSVVIALPAHASLRLWSDSGLPSTAISQRWSGLERRAITTVWLALDRSQERQLARLPQWFVFNPQPELPHIGQVAVRRPGILGIVISAQRLRSHDITSPADERHAEQPESLRSELERMLAAQLHVQLGLNLAQTPQKWITEKSATWACTVDAPPPTDTDVRGQTGLDGLYRCADDLVPGYPATIESAVRSGNRTAEQLIMESS